MILAILLQARQSTSPAFNSGQTVGMGCGLLIMALMVVGAIYVIVKYPSQMGGRFAVGALLLILPFTGVFIGLVSGLAGGPPPLGALALIPLAWAAWLGLFIFMRIAIRRDERREQEVVADRQQWQAAYNPAGGPGPHPQAAPALPRFQRNEAAPAQAGPIEDDAPVIARCAACMGRWRTTKAEADALEACPKCGASPPDLRLQPAG